ncbi:MAG: YjfB family protein [Methylomonas sp.]|nr:YjfB family protein [Methylomonas sp.]
MSDLPIYSKKAATLCQILRPVFQSEALMLDSVTSIAAFATQMSMQKNAQQVQLAVLNKVREQQDIQGQAVLKLLESAVQPAQRIDVYV